MEDIEKKCPVTEDDIILYVDRELGEAEKRRVESHIKICEKCRGLYETYVRVDRTASELFVSKRPLPEVRLEKPFFTRIADAIKNMIAPRRGFVFGTAALAVLIFSAFLFYYGAGENPKLFRAAIGKFISPAFHNGIGPVDFPGPYEIVADGATVEADTSGVFLSEKFNIIFEAGAKAKLGSTGICLASGAIDIDYFKKPAPADFEISTPNARIFIRGTRLAVSFLDSVTKISVAEGRVAVLKKEGELIINAGERAVVMKEGEPSLLPKLEEPVNETRETELKIQGEHKNTSAAAPVHNGDKTEEAKISEISRTSGTLQSPLTSETVLKDDENAAAPVKTGEVITEKILDYEVDLDSMDEKTRRIFFPKRQ
jgi:hypothetical protein